MGEAGAHGKELFAEIGQRDDALNDITAISYLKKMELFAGALVVEPAFDTDGLAQIFGNLGDSRDFHSVGLA